jgi:chemotaxis response regulator CheB
MSYDLIAIGASWGGLLAVGTLLEGIPAELDQAIVIAQHRSPESTRGALEALLQRHIARPVSEPG